MFGFRPAWFVHVNPQTTYPRYIKTIDPTGKTGIYFGPVEDKHAAQKLVHTMENLFDLCRDYSFLTAAPAGACPWKQMDKCVGPCDGSVSLEAYRELVAYSTKALMDPRDYEREQTGRMQQAAAELRFEVATKIKAYIEQIAQLGKGPFRHVRHLREFQYVTLQRGPRAGTAKMFLITPGQIDLALGLIHEPEHPADILRHILGLAHDRRDTVVDEIGSERIGVVSHHLFQPKARQGVFLPLETLDEKALAKAYRDLMNQKPQDDATGEGVVKELQAL
jgi:excinuclease UvrABC nuclease subunit